VLEINDKRAFVVGIAHATPTFQSQPIIFTTYTRAKNFALNERKLLSYILVKAKADESAQVVAQPITDETDLAARTADEFKRLSLAYFVKNTGVLINFGFVVLVGFIVGTAVTGQIFYNFTLDNLRHFGVFKAMGTTDRMLVLTIVLQALLAGLVGFGIGAGATAIFAAATQGGSGLAMTLNWRQLLGSGVAVLLIMMLAAFLSLRQVLQLEPAVVFKG
jgi:putative ABC transport system permease protein